MMKEFDRCYSWARAIHAFRLRSEGLKYREIAVRLGPSRGNRPITRDRARQLSDNGERIVNHPIHDEDEYR